MARPTTRQALLDASDSGYRALIEEVEAIPASRRDEEFPFEGRDRTVRDVVCHLHEWHELMLGWYAAGMRGDKPDIPAAGYTWRTTPDLNRELWAKNQDTSLEEALSLFERSHRAVRELVAERTDEELFTKKRYAWTGSTSLGAYLVSSTSSHYDWGLKKVRRLRKHIASPRPTTSRATATQRQALPESLEVALIAPCGMDCGLCRGHQREKNRCPGCNGEDAAKPRYCLTCKIKTCDEIAGGVRTYCFGCASFPCTRLRQLDRRYRTKYGMSMLENLARIEELGVEAFVANEKERWACPDCGALLSVHRPDCAACGNVWNRRATGPEESS